MTQHILITPQTCNCCKVNPYIYCPVCHGELSICSVCGGAEGWLTTECPGEKVPYEKGEQVGRGILDFVFGEWTTTVIGDCQYCKNKHTRCTIDLTGHNMCHTCSGNLPYNEE